jgi:hypothetical protein
MFIGIGGYRTKHGGGTAPILKSYEYAGQKICHIFFWQLLWKQRIGYYGGKIGLGRITIKRNFLSCSYC